MFAEGAETTKNSRKEQQSIAENDAGEDTYLSKAPARIFNWHFYSPDKEEEKKYWLVNRSMVGLVRAIERQISTSRRFDSRLAGGALHFIEDVTVPAHVAPVFHGPLPPLILSGPTGRYYPAIIHDPVDG